MNSILFGGYDDYEEDWDNENFYESPKKSYTGLYLKKELINK